MTTLENLLRTQTKGIIPQNNQKVIMKIPLKNGHFWEKEYNQNDTIGKVIDEFKKENNEEIPEDYMTEWKHKNNSLKMTDEIRTLLINETPTLLIDHETLIKPLCLKEEKIPDIIGKPFNEPFEVYYFYKKNKILKIQKYGEELIENEELNNYSSSSAYCNGNNYLFISGGETKNYKILKNFWIINLENHEINQIDMLSPKKNHSMIFIGGNYVFIIGGNDLKTFYYNIENNEMNEWVDLNKKRTEPALILVNNYLYCLDNVNSKNNNEAFSLEKTDVSSKIPKWEIINPNMNYAKLNQKFFGISKTEDNNIILLGGNMDEDENKYNYKYNINNNTIEMSNIPFKEYNFKEKTFIPYNKNIDYILPDFNRHHPEIIFYQKKKNKLTLVKYEPNYDQKLLRNTHKPLQDFKYNFNMPSINLPTTENLINKENININNIEESKLEEKQDLLNSKNPNLNNVNNNILFNSPEIILNKPDNKININISTEDNILIPEQKGINRINNDENKIQLDMDNKLIPNNKNNLYTEGIGIITEIPDLNYQPVNLDIINNNNKSIGDINVNSPKIDIDDQNIKFRNKQGNITIPGDDLNAQNPEQNNIQFDKDKNKLPDIILNPGNQLIDTNINIPKKDNEYSYHLPIIDSNSKIEVKTDIPQIVTNPINININESDKNIKGPSNVMPNDKSDFYLSGIIPGFNENGKIKINESNINILNSNNLNNNINVKGPKLDINGPTINTNLKVSNDRQIQGRDINGSNLKLYSGNINGNIPSVNIKNENGIENNFFMEGIIQGKKTKETRINMASTNVNINKPKIDSSELKINGNAPDFNINAQNPNINFNKGFNISGIIEGKKKIDINAPNIKNNMDLNLKNSNKIDINEKHKMTNSYMSGIIQGINNIPHIDAPDINLKGPNLKTSNINIKEKSTEFGIINPKINLPSGNTNIKVNGSNHELKMSHPELDINMPQFDIKGSNIPNLELNSKIIDSKIDVNAQKFDINAPNLELNSKIIDSKIDVGAQKFDINAPKIDINKDIPGIIIESKNIELPSSDINLKTSKLNKRIDVNGNLPGMKIDDPNINIKSPNLNIKGSNLDNLDTNPKSNFYLSGIIGGNNSLKKYNNINGKMNTNNINGPKIGINDLKSEVNIKGQNTELCGFIPGIKVKDSNVNIPSGDINIRGPDINGKMPNTGFNMKGPNFSESKINGNLEGNINLKGQNPSITGNIPGVNIDSQKINIHGPSVNFKESKVSSYGDFFLSGIIPSKNDKNGNIIMKDSTIGPSINANGDYNFQKKINFHGNVNKENYLENENEIKGSRKLINVDNMNNFNIEMPKIDIKNNNNLNVVESKKIGNEEGNLGGEILLNNKPYIDIKNDNQFGINANIDGIIKTEDINIGNLGMNFASEDNTKVILNSANGENGIMRKKGKGLPMVGNKSNNFQASKVDTI